jgi:hypothetical protein
MRCWIAGLALFAAAPVLAEARLTEEAIGPFKVVREDYRNSGTPIMHVADEWTRVRLQWTSADGLAEFQLEDDGMTLKGLFSASASGRQGGCSRVGSLHAYGEGPPTGAFWRANARDFAAFLRGCDAVERSAANRYMAEYDAAGERFAEALDRLKAEAIEAFRSIERRCIAYGPVEYLSGIPAPTCARWSGRVGGR